MVRFSGEFEEICAKKFEPDSKIGILSSVSPDGYPHLSLITSIGVKTKKTLMWGQFSRGLSKTYLADNPKTGFLVVSPDQYWWTGKALHAGSVVKGEDFEYFNNKPLFRYNSYCGFGAVHYGEIKEVSAGEKLPLPRILLGSVTSALLKKGAAKYCLQAASGGDRPAKKIPPYGLKLCSNLACLKFIAWVDTDGFPRIIPALQGLPLDADNLVFSASPYGELLKTIPPQAKAAVFLANLALESLLLQGRWLPLNRHGRFRGGIFAADKVYNSMLPLNRYIYPPEELPRVYG
ncbi:pyridoxamine 5'-phosphate oxidase family protein [Treponema sp. TIM-1]|uniref:pyridoxamine 5'-phosphate oxidase family protein n=1 Tax=Treponema sp. TIM-1 TaxID=2898417 RepID=UPI0039816704